MPYYCSFFSVKMVFLFTFMHIYVGLCCLLSRLCRARIGYGHEKLAQPYGLYIYAVVDTFSRKVLALNVLPDKSVSDWLVKALPSINGNIRV